MELPKNFGTWMCVTDTENFKRGELYASIGNNDGVQVAYFDEYGETRVVPFWLRDDYLEDDSGHTIFIRHNNKRTVPQILLEVVEEMCDKFCKYKDTWDEEAEGIELCESDICGNCPLNRLT